MNPDPGRLSPHPPCRLHLCRFERRTRVRGRAFCPAAILLRIDAFDSKRSNSRRPVRLLDYYGGSGCVDLPDRGQRWHGHWFHASHRNSFTVNELRRIFGVVYVPGAGCGYECPHAPVRELRVGARRGSPATGFVAGVTSHLSQGFTSSPRAFVRNCPARKRPKFMF